MAEKLKKQLTFAEVAEKLNDPSGVLDPTEISVWLGVARRTVIEEITKTPRFPKPLPFILGRRKTPRYTAESLRKWAGLS